MINNSLGQVIMKKPKFSLTLILMVISAIFISNCKKEDPKPLPIANFTFTGENVVAPCEVSFSNTSTYATTYLWEFGDGTRLTEQNPKHTYLIGGTFTVKLTATGEGGTNSTSKSVTIQNPILAPVANSASSVLYSSFTANWISSATATGYRLDVATDIGFTAFLSGFTDKDVSNVTTYSVTGLTANTSYYYRVRAYNLSKTSSNSGTITVITLPITAADIIFTVTGDKNFEETIYPSVILGLSNYISRSESDFFDFSLKNPLANSTLKIKIEATNLSSETIFQTQLATKDVIYKFSPLIKWNFTALKQLKQAGSVDMTFVCYINDKEIDRKNLRYAYRSVNECVYGFYDNTGKYTDLKWMFAAFVNEDNPKIDQILQQTLTYNIVNSFIGYQGTEQAVKDQVNAIWYYLQCKSVKYSSITASSNPSTKVLTQYVRFFDDVYNNTQANCADGTVFLASILKKIGLFPVLIVVPGHMYLGYYTKADKSKIQLLETTMVGLVNQAEIYEDVQYVYGLTKYANYLSAGTRTAYFNGTVTLAVVKKEITYNSFLEATNYQISNFNNNLSNFNDQNNNAYKIFDIDVLRSLVQTIGNKK